VFGSKIMSENTSVGQPTTTPDGVNASVDTPDYAEWQALLHGDLFASNSPISLAARTATTLESSSSASPPSGAGVLGTQAQVSSPPLPLSDAGTTSPTPIIGFSASPQLSVGIDAGPGSQTVDPIVATFDVKTPGSGLVFDNSIAGNYSGNTLTEFENDVISAETMLEKQATNSFTINVELEAANQGANGDGADNNSLVYGTYTYAQLKSALTAKESGNAIGQIALQHLPATDPSGGVGFYIPTAYARFLGLTTASGGVELANGTYAFSTSYAFDSAVILNTNYVSDYGQDAIDALTHELSETSMGRVGGLGSQTVGGKPYWTTMDLFRYTSAGQYDTTDGKDGQSTYFSYNGGQTTSASANLSFFNNYNTRGTFSGGDNDDWGFSSAPDIFGPVSTVGGLSQTDDQILESLGWDPVLVAPTVNVQNVSPAENTVISASSLISSVSNPSGDTITEYIFDDQGRNGHFTFNGTIEPDGTSFAVPVGSLSAVKYIAGTLSGADTIVISLGYETPGSTTTLVSSSSSLTATTSVSNDFNGDGKSDVLWENLASGDVGWNDGPLTAWHDLGVVQTTYDVVATTDFTGDGRTDLLWSNPTTGDIGWNDGPNTTWHDLGTAPTSYQVVGTGDFNSDGVRDILWADPATGDVGWNDGPNTAWHDLGAAPTSYSVIGVADFNNDGSSDLIWYNPGSGDIGWNDGPQTTWHDLGVAPTTYQVVGIADFNNDGQSDLVWSDPATGDIGWNNGPNTTWHDLGVAPPGYAVVGTGDYNGNGNSDLLWSNAATGEIGWNNGPNTAWHDLGVAPTSYNVIHFV
jgi:hypothetical protein